MKLPDFSQSNQLSTNDYMVNQDPGAQKKKKILIGVGIALLLITLSFVLFSGKPTPGEIEMKRSLQATSDALGMVDEYSKELNYAPTQNDIALVQTLLRGNFQELNTLYNTTFKPKQRFKTNPKPDDKSIEKLDEAVRNNTIDNTIISVLQPKITLAEKNLRLAKPLFTKKDSVKTIQTAIDDMSSISEVLSRDR